MARTYKQGKYNPVHPEKYRGDVRSITFRSSWELRAFEYMDHNPNVIQWGSEIIAIPYLKPEELIKLQEGISHRPKFSRYFPDIWAKIKNKNGQITEQVIEIKPYSQTIPSTRKHTKTKMQEDYVYALNKCKWKAAANWCKERGIIFRVMTERDLF